MKRINLFKKDLEAKKAVKIIAGIDNFDIDRVRSVVIAADRAGASAVDVSANEEIIKMAKEGKTCIVVSSEMPEILGITNRIAVMSNHRIAGIVNTKDTNQEELLRLSAKYI